MDDRHVSQKREGWQGTGETTFSRQPSGHVNLSPPDPLFEVSMGRINGDVIFLPCLAAFDAVFILHLVHHVVSPPFYVRNYVLTLSKGTGTGLLVHPKI
jgi:hypothetical protein